MKASTILLIEPDRQTADFLRLTLEGAGHQLKHVTAGKEGLIIAWRDQVDLIVTELDLPDIDGIELIEKLRRDRRTERTPIIVLTHVSAPDKTAAAMEAGADRYLVKQPDAVDQLMQFIASIRPSGPEPKEQLADKGPGVLIAMLGVRGGVGTSSLTANIAHQLGLQIGAEQVVLLDLDLPLGSLQEITGGSPDVNIVELTAVDLPEMRPEEIRERLTPPKGWSMSLISGIHHPGDAERIHVTQIGPALQTLRAFYRYILVDLGRSLGAISRLVLSQANLIILVFFPDELGVSNAMKIRESLFQDGIPPDRLLFLSNRPYPTDSLTSHSLQERLSGSEVKAIPNMDDNIALANAVHMPFQRRFPEARGTLALEDVVSRIRERLGTAQAG
ncbi:MAG: response regulator [Anaerolineales bacterium]